MSTLFRASKIKNIEELGYRFLIRSRHWRLFCVQCPGKSQGENGSPKHMVSIIIPTRNEEYSLPFSLASIQKQSYGEIETIVVDGDSQDGTKRIAYEFGAKVVNHKGGRLGARVFGFQLSKGDYILSLDADQILAKDTIERAVSTCTDFDFLFLEELSYLPQTWVERTLSHERKSTHDISTQNLMDGNLIPRFFKRRVLESALSKLLKQYPEYDRLTFSDDHLIYREVRNISSSASLIPEAVFHMEEKSLGQLFIHLYRVGKTHKLSKYTGIGFEIVPQMKSAEINKLISTIRTGSLRLLMISITRSLAYRLGYLTSRPQNN
jgi:glycosyltransferase involved in cell wall biosynthesis